MYHLGGFYYQVTQKHLQYSAGQCSFTLTQYRNQDDAAVFVRPMSNTPFRFVLKDSLGDVPTNKLMLIDLSLAKQAQESKDENQLIMAALSQAVMNSENVDQNPWTGIAEV